MNSEQKAHFLTLAKAGKRKEAFAYRSQCARDAAATFQQTAEYARIMKEALKNSIRRESPLDEIRRMRDVWGSNVSKDHWR